MVALLGGDGMLKASDYAGNAKPFKDLHQTKISQEEDFIVLASFLNLITHSRRATRVKRRFFFVPDKTKKEKNSLDSEENARMRYEKILVILPKKLSAP